MKNVLVIFGDVLLVICLPLIFVALDNARTESYDQSFTGITTGAAETTSNVTLGLELYDDSITHVVSITSNITGDSPTAADYNSASRLLTISGLLVNTDRTLSIEYEIASLSLAALPSAGVFLSVFAYFIIFGILGLIAGAIFGMFKRV